MIYCGYGEDLERKGDRSMERDLTTRDGRLQDRLIFCALLGALYVSLFFFLRAPPLYDVAHAHGDRLFSADDVYYASHFYSTTLETSLRVIKHPLFIMFGWFFAHVEQAVFGVLSPRAHYELIVLFQICVSCLSTLYLDLILEEQYRLRRRDALLLCTVYALAFSTLFYTFIVESYILSSCLLMMTYYYARKGSAVPVVVLGALAAGVTVTNSIAWALIVFLTRTGSIKRRVLLLFLGGAGFLAATALSPVGEVFFRDPLSVCFGTADSYSDHFSFFTALRYLFFLFFGSGFFFVGTQSCSPYGEFPGDALSFVPEASAPIVLAVAAWCVLLLAAVWRGRRDPLLTPPLGVLAFNLLLHGALQYGLKESFLYVLHHLSAQVLIVAVLLRAEDGGAGERRRAPERAVPWAVAAFAVCLLALNVPGYARLLDHIGG